MSDATKAQLALLGARGLEATSKRTSKRLNMPQPSSTPSPVQPAGESCPVCKGGVHFLNKVITCPDCGEFDSDGRGGWALRGHTGGIMEREILGFPVRFLPDLPMQVALVCQRAAQRIVHAADDNAQMRSYNGSVAEWLELRGEWLRTVSVGDVRR